ncbi:hypothetical protein Tco_0019345 [Tanacetum coccineum]
MYLNLNQLQWQLESKYLHICDPKSCLDVLITPFKKCFDSKDVNALDFHNKSWQKDFKDNTRYEPETYRRNLLQYLDVLDKLIDERVLKYGELRLKEREVQAIKEIEKRLKEKEIQQQESLVTKGTTLEACLVTKGVVMEACLLTEAATLEACLVTEGIKMDDSLVAKERTDDSVTSSKQLDESSSSRNECSRSWNKNRSSDHESTNSGNDADVDIGPSYDNDTMSKGLVKEMKDDLKYVMSLEDEFDETCLLLDIQQEFFKTQFESVKSESYSHDKGKSLVSNFQTPKVSVSLKIYKGESSKSFPKRVTQFTTYSLQKDRKFSKKPQVYETPTPQKVLNSNDSSKKRQGFQTLNSRFTPVMQVWRPKQSHSKSFKYSKSELLSLQNKNDSTLKILNSGRFPFISKINSQNETPGFNKWKSSSSSRFKTPQENPSFYNQWKNKRNFKSPLIPRALFPNETSVSSSRWNSTSLHQIGTIFKWFSKFGKPISTVLKWVPKVIV